MEEKPDAQLTVEFVIFDAIVQHWHKKDDPNFVFLIRDEIFNSLFKPQYSWAIKELANDGR